VKVDPLGDTVTGCVSRALRIDPPSLVSCRRSIPGVAGCVWIWGRWCGPVTTLGGPIPWRS